MCPQLPENGWWDFCKKCDLPTYNLKKICNTCIYNSKKKSLHTNKWKLIRKIL